MDRGGTAASVLAVALSVATAQAEPLIHLVAEPHQRPGDPLMASVPLAKVGGVSKPVIQRSRPCEPPVFRIVPRAPVGRLAVEMAIPAAMRQPPLEIEGTLVAIGGAVPERLRSGRLLGPNDFWLVAGAGLDVGHRIAAALVMPPPAPDRRHVFLFDVDAPMARGDALLIAHACSRPRQRHETGPIAVPPGARLRFAIGVERGGNERGSARFTIVAREEERAERIFRAAWRSAPWKWQEHTVDLAPWGGRTVRFELAADTKAEASGTNPIAVFGDPTIEAGDAETPRWNVLLVSLDTLRRDRLGCYGYERPTTPTIDRELAARGAVFSRAFASFPSTAGSHATIFTSLDPCVHGFVDTMEPPALRADAPTLAEILRANGYETAAFTEGGWLMTGLGFARGFTSYVEYAGADADPNSPSGGAAATFATTQQWIETHRDRPWFVFAHTYQMHHPYAPPPGYVARIGYPAEKKATDSELYDGEIRYTDDMLARVLAGIERAGVADRTLVVLLSDHGEQFGEHGLAGHANALYETLLRVPLILRAPGRIAAGRRIDAVVGLIDVMPTILDLVGVPLPPSVQGRSMLRLLDGGEWPERTLYAETAKYKHESGMLVAARRGELKWIIDPVTGRARAYDLRADPGEERDVSRTLPAQTPAAIMIEFRRHCRVPQAAAPVSPQRLLPTREIDPAQRDRLRALGYID